MNFSGKMDNKCVFSLHFLRIPGISSHFRNSSFSISADCFRVVQPNRAMTGEYQSFRKFRQGNKPFLHSSGKRCLTKVVFGRGFLQKNVAEWLFRHIFQDTIFL